MSETETEVKEIGERGIPETEKELRLRQERDAKIQKQANESQKIVLFVIALAIAAGDVFILVTFQPVAQNLILIGALCFLWTFLLLLLGVWGMRDIRKHAGDGTVYG